MYIQPTGHLVWGRKQGIFDIVDHARKKRMQILCIISPNTAKTVYRIFDKIYQVPPIKNAST